MTHLISFPKPTAKGCVGTAGLTLGCVGTLGLTLGCVGTVGLILG